MTYEIRAGEQTYTKHTKRSAYTLAAYLTGNGYDSATVYLDDQPVARYRRYEGRTIRVSV
jgi:hypothetical protein